MARCSSGVRGPGSRVRVVAHITEISYRMQNTEISKVPLKLFLTVRGSEADNEWTEQELESDSSE